MKKILIYILLTVAGSLLLAACKGLNEETEAPYLDAIPEVFEGSALGDGDAFLFSVRSNVSWTLKAVDESGNEVDWIRFEQASGEGDADIFCIILRGIQERMRSCTLVLVSTDGKLEKRVPLDQTIFVPEYRTVTMKDMLLTANSVAPGETDFLEEFCYFNAEVTGVPGPNLPDGYVYITDDGTAFVRIQTDQASSLKVGDKITIETTAGTVTMSNYGVTFAISKPITVNASGPLTAPPAYIPAAYVPKYENALVELRCAQAQDSEVGKTWGGDVNMCTYDEASDNAFKTHVESAAPFASDAVPANSGTIVGIVVDGKLRPRDASDLSGMTAERGSYTVPYTIEPIYCFLKNAGTANKISNVETVGKTKIVFTDEPGYSYAGASVEKVVGGTDNNLSFTSALATPFLAMFTVRGWDRAGTHFLYTIPVDQKVWGKLELCFGICCGTAGVFDQGEWTVSWSTDGVNFKAPDAVYSATNLNPADAAGDTFGIVGTSSYTSRQLVEFQIPENEAVTSGGALYFKMFPPTIPSSRHTTTLRWLNGFIVCSQQTNTPKKPYQTIVAMENFENSWWAHDPVIGIPLYNFARPDGAPAYTSEEGWTVTGKSAAIRGCLLLNATSGENYIQTPPLSKLYTQTDLKVTFKASPYVDASAKELVVNTNAISTVISGPGTASKISWDSSNFSAYGWHTGTFTVSGATSDTMIGIGVTDPNAKNCAFYIDDIIVTK